MALATASCSTDEVDVTAPSFTQITLNGSEESVTITPESRLLIQLDAKDDESVSQLKIDIHDAFDNHEHGKTNNTPWTYVNVLNVEGGMVSEVDSPLVPLEASAGRYHAVFRVLDASGNEGDYVEREVYITNGSEPIISVTNPDFNSVNYSLGDVISLSGIVSDDDGLDDVEVFLLHEEEEHHHHQIEAIEVELTGTAPTSHTISNLELTIPADEEAGTYAVMISAIDALGNQAIFEVEFIVTE